MEAKSVSLLGFINALPVGMPRIVFTPCVDAAVDSLQLEPIVDQCVKTIVLEWGSSPRIDDAISHTVTRLAELALEHWPEWLGLNNSKDTFPRRGELVGLAQQGGLMPLWLSQAWVLAKAGKLPLIPAMSNGENVRHITSLFGSENLQIIFILKDSDRNHPNLDGLCRMLLWLENNTGARLTLLLDPALSGSSELSSLDYQAYSWRSPLVPEINGAATENKKTLWPIEGKPHPASPGERLLEKLLQTDPLLAGVFQFNQPVITVYGNRFYVDLLAPLDHAIVEIDGYSHHSSQAAFSLDRQRDYELQTSGYLVLRIPHHELIKNPQACIDKIGNLIVYQRRKEKAA